MLLAKRQCKTIGGKTAKSLGMPEARGGWCRQLTCQTYPELANLNVGPLAIRSPLQYGGKEVSDVGDSPLNEMNCLSHRRVPAQGTYMPSARC